MPHSWPISNTAIAPLTYQFSVPPQWCRGRPLVPKDQHLLQQSITFQHGIEISWVGEKNRYQRLMGYHCRVKGLDSDECCWGPMYQVKREQKNQQVQTAVKAQHRAHHGYLNSHPKESLGLKTELDFKALWSFLHWAMPPPGTDKSAKVCHQNMLWERSLVHPKTCAWAQNWSVRTQQGPHPCTFLLC